MLTDDRRTGTSGAMDSTLMRDSRDAETDVGSMGSGLRVARTSSEMDDSTELSERGSGGARM